ncbi:MAG TPA: flagellar basal-body rod protein FlgF [Rhizomicrobium sp.]|nr:flagellar basal-body rod protein FlgF [Rhizomicrobium sp.]
MDATLLVNLSQQLAAYRSMDVIANNLANVSTAGFKRESTKFEEYVQHLPDDGSNPDGPQALSFVMDRGLVRDTSEGRMDRTGAPYDLAISGKGFFVVKTAAGDRYTRNGHFTLDSQGRISTEGGELLQGEGGEVSVTSDDGDINIAVDGTITGRQGQLGKLRVVQFDNERAMTKDGNSLYSTDQAPTPATTAAIHQGMIESSNVQPVLEISNMLEVMRAYQAATNIADSQDKLSREAIQKLGAAPTS